MYNERQLVGGRCTQPTNPHPLASGLAATETVPGTESTTTSRIIYYDFLRLRTPLRPPPPLLDSRQKTTTNSPYDVFGVYGNSACATEGAARRYGVRSKQKTFSLDFIEIQI